MAEDLTISGTSREEIYQGLIPQIQALVQGESDYVANLGNIAAALKEAFGFFWVGFYLVRGNELLLGPFQGPVACTRIAFGKGVCGAAWKEMRPMLVPNVDEFPGHIACSSRSKSEVVVTLTGIGGDVIRVLDVDSDQLNDFSSVDVTYLEKIAAIASACL